MVQQAGREVWGRFQLHDEEIRQLKSRLAGTHVGSRLAPTVVTGVIPPSSGGTGFSLNGSPLGVTVWLSPGATTQYSVVTSASSRTYGTSAVQGAETVIGVNDDAAAGAGENIRVRHIGYQSSVRVGAAVTAGHYLRQSTSAGVAESAGAVQTSGVFARALTANAGPGAGNVEAYLFPPVPQSIYYSGHIRVGSFTAPSNTTAGDLTSARLFSGDDAAVANNARVRLNVASHVPATSTTHYHEIQVIVAPNGSSTSERDPFDIEYLVRPTAHDGGLHIAYRVHARHDSGAFNLTHTSNALLGTSTIVDQNVAASTVTYMAAVRANARVLAGSATTVVGFTSTGTGGGTAVTSWYAFHAEELTTPSGITTHAGLRIEQMGAAGITTAIGVDIAAQSGSTNNIGIRNASNLRQTGYGSFVGASAPLSTTDGDVTMTRLNVGNSAFGTDNVVKVVGTSTLASGTPTIVSVLPTFSPASAASTQYRAIQVAPTLGATAAHATGFVRGLDFSFTHNTDQAIGTMTAIIASGPIWGTASPAVRGTVTEATVFHALPFFNAFVGTVTGAITTLANFRAQGMTTGGLTVTTWRDFQVVESTAGAITTHVGLEIPALTVATTNIGIRNLSPLRQVGDSIFGLDSAPAALVHIHQPTLGNEAFRTESAATNDDPADRWSHGRAATTDATVTTLQTITIPASTTVLLTVWVRARRTGGTAGTAEDAAGYMLVATLKNVAGTATVVGAVAQVVVQEDQAAWDATIDVTGATARVRVTGALDNNVTWHSTTVLQQVST